MEKLINKIKTFDWKKPKNRYIFIGVIVVAVFLIGLFILTKKTQSDADDQVLIPEVTLTSVAGLSSGGEDIPLSGKVKSVNEVEIRAEAGGLVQSVNYSLGDYVGAGAIIASVENASQRNEVERAQNLVDSATSQFKSGSASLDETRQNLINTIKSAYTTADDSTRNHIYKFFGDGFRFGFNFSTIDTTYFFNGSDYNLEYKVNVGRENVDKNLKQWQIDLAKINLATQDEKVIKEQITEAQKNLVEIRDLLDDMALFVNKFTINELAYKSVVDGYKTEISSTRATINGTISSLIATSDAYNSKKALYVTSEDIGKSSSEVGIDQAKISLRQAEINLEKTHIRSPISGTINNFNLSVGDYLSPMQQVAVVSNNGALEIITYVSENDRMGVSVGNSVLINNKTKGVVTNIAPALDPVTKKIEVKIGITGNSEELINGQSVSLSLAREKNKEASVLNLKQLTIPLSALKVEPDRMVVFSVEKGILKANVVKEGPIVGDKIIITGVDPSLEIITDARGLQEGDAVKVGVKTQ